MDADHASSSQDDVVADYREAMEDIRSGEYDRRRQASTAATASPRVCAKCEANTETKGDSGRYGKFLHVRCFDSWWRSEYEWTGGPYYHWMREGMCVR